MRTPQAQEKFEKRWDKLNVALNHGKPVDRCPVIIMGHIPCAKYADPEIVPADIIESPEYFIDKSYEGLEELKYADSINVFTAGYSKAAGLALMSGVKMPGIDINREDILQIDEHPYMEYDDYKTIIEKGWNAYKADYIANRLNCTPEDMAAGVPFSKYSLEKNDEAGYVLFSGCPHPAGWDALSAMRGMNVFFRDLRKDPQMIKDTLAVMCEDEWDNYLKMLKDNAETKSSFACMLQPAVRANCDFVSKKTYEEFVMPYATKFGNAILDSGNTIHFHYDAKWDDFLDLYTEFPKNRCIFDSDGLTDIYKVKKILGDTMAITGNVPAALLAIGNPDEVYEFVKNQIKEIGPDGYFVCSSCTIPANCKPENLKAMVEASKEIH